MYSHLLRTTALVAISALLMTGCFGQTGAPAGSPSPAAAATTVSTGSDVKATLSGDPGSGTKNVTITFASVSGAGEVKAEPAAAIPALPAGFSRTAAFDISTTAQFDKATVCLDNDKVTARSKLYHYVNNTWNDRTTTVTPPQICGEFTSFSPVAIVEGLAATATPAPTTAPTTAPTATPAPSPTPAATATATATAAPTATPSPTQAAVATATPARTATPRPATAAPTLAPSPTPAPTPTPSPTPSPTPARTFAPAVPTTGLAIWGNVTDAATGQPIDRACIALGPPIACTTRTDPNGRFVIDLSEMGAGPGSTFRLSALRNDVEPKYALIQSPQFVVNGVVQQDLKLSKQ